MMAWPSATCLSRPSEELKGRATLDLIADADHAFHVPARTGRKDPDVLAAALAVTVRWMAGV